MLMAKSNRGFFQKSRCVTLRQMIQSGKFSNFFSSKISSMSTLSASFRQSDQKKELWWWYHAFSHYKSMGPCSCYSNQGFHWIFMQSLCHRCPTVGILKMRNDWDQPVDCGAITGKRCWLMTDGRTDNGWPTIRQAHLEPSGQVS